MVDAHQCKSDVGCPGVTAPDGVHAVDGYTVKSELTYGVNVPCSCGYGTHRYCTYATFTPACSNRS